MSQPRRMGAEGSQVRARFVDAVEAILSEEGYHGISARQVASKAGLKTQLLYYYFRTMDDLLLATFKRRTERARARLAEEVTADQPIQAIWKNLTSTVDGKLAFEFVALANHHDGIRQEVARFMTESRRMEAAAIERQFKQKGIDMGPVTPSAAALIMYSVSLILRREEATGITEGHDAVLALMDWVLKRVS